MSRDVALRCGTKGCPNPPTEKVPDAKLPHVVYDFCSSCAVGMRALQKLPDGALIEAKDLPPLTFERLTPVRDAARGVSEGLQVPSTVEAAGETPPAARDFLCSRCGRYSPGDIPWCGHSDCRRRNRVVGKILYLVRRHRG